MGAGAQQALTADRCSTARRRVKMRGGHPVNHYLDLQRVHVPRWASGVEHDGFVVLT